MMPFDHKVKENDQTVSQLKTVIYMIKVAAFNVYNIAFVP